MNSFGIYRAFFIILPALVTPLKGQPTIAPTPEVTGPATGENTGDFNVTQSFELGHRWFTVGGNLGKYRSDVNFRNGVRLLQGNVTVHSLNGRGKLFDEIVLSTQGLGGDPYQYASLRLAKNSLFEYNLVWRQNSYYNPALPLVSGLHLLDTNRMLQDHNLSLQAAPSLRLLLGYSRNRQSGPSLTTSNLGGSGGTEAALFGNVRRLQDEYRLGAEFDWKGWRFS
ncbi:MAG: hypothetical protein ACRD7E_11405, partial [Bryobacteraceae bacterium]